jgi:glycosyltransferase involved in cell wall biosynthesis
VGKLSMNKGHHLLPMMFNKAFGEADNVELWMSSHNPFLSASELKEWLKLYKDSPLGHKIRFLPEVASQRDLADLMNRADCGIFPALCEGWNLGLLEMMSMGKPVIATNYSGHTGFCTNENAYLVSPNDVESANDNKWFFGTGNWAKITNKEIDEFVDHLRYCYKERPNNEEGVKTGEKLTWRNSAEIISRIMLG